MGTYRKPIRDRPSNPLLQKTCPNCKGPFTTQKFRPGKSQLFCSRECRQAFHNKRYRAFYAKFKEARKKGDS